MSETSGGGFGGESAGVLYIDVQARMDSLESSMREMEQKAAKASKDAGEGAGAGFGKSFKESITSALPEPVQKITESLTSIQGLAIGVGAAIGAAIAAGLKTAFDMAQQAAQGVKDFQASLGASKEEAEALGVVARKVFVNNWGEDLGAAQKAVANVRKEVQGLNDTDLQAVTEGSIAIADRFEEDQSKVAAAVQSLMNATGMSAQQAMDFISAGFQKGLNSSGDFLDTLQEYGPIFEKSKIQGGELFSLLETGAAKGALGTDKVADAFKEFGLRAADGAKATQAAYAQLGLDYDKLTKQLGEGKISYTQLFELVTTKLKGVQSQADRTNIATALFGGAGEDLGSKLPQLDLTRKKIEDLKGSTDTVKAATNTLGSVFQSAWKMVQDQLIPIGNIMLDLANEAMPTVQAAIARLGPVVTMVVKGLVEGWKEVRPALEPVGNLFQSVFGLIVTLWNNVLKPVLVAIAPFVDSVVTSVGSILGFAVRVVTDVINAVAALFRGDWKAAWASLKDIATGAVDGLIKGLHAADEKFFAWGRGIVTGMGRALGGMKAMLLDKMADALRALEERMPEFMRGTVERAAQAAQDAAGQTRANMQPNTTYAGIGPRQDEAAKAAPAEAGKLGYAFISGLTERFKNDPRFPSDCAAIGGTILNYIGLGIKQSASARELMQNARNAHWQEVDNSSLKNFRPGDLLTYQGSQYGLAMYNPNTGAYLGSRGQPGTQGGVGYHSAVFAGYDSKNRPTVIENPGSSNTHLRVLTEQELNQLIVLRSPQSPFAAGAQPVTQQPKTNTSVTVPIKPPPTAKDIQAELDAKIKNIQARLQLKIIGKDEAIKELKVVEDAAIRGGQKGGDGLLGYAEGAKAAHSAIESLKGGSKSTVDVLAALERQYAYAGKSGLPAYVAGLKAFVAQQEKVVASTKDGTKAHNDAMDKVIQGRQKLAAVQKTAALGLTTQDVSTYRARAEEVIKLEKGLSTSTDLEWKRRAQNRIDSYKTLPPAAQKVLELLKSQEQQDTERSKKQAALRAEIANQQRQMAVSTALAAQKRLAELDSQELASFKGTAAQRAAVVKRQADDEYNAAVRVAQAQLKEAQAVANSGKAQLRGGLLSAAQSAYDQAVLEAEGKRKAASQRSQQDIKAEASQVQELLGRYAASREAMQKLVSEGKFDPAQLKEFNKSLADLWRGAQQAGLATDPLVKKAHEGAKAWGLQARAWSDAQAEQLGLAQSEEEYQKIVAAGFEKYGSGLDKPKANVDELFANLIAMRGELQEPGAVDNLSAALKHLGDEGLITKEQLEMLLATLKDLSTAPAPVLPDNLEGRGVQVSEAPITDAARGYLDDAGKKAYQAMLDGFDADGKDKAQELGKMLAELIAKGFGDSDQARMLRDWIDNYQREFNSMLLNSGTVRVGVDGEFIAVSENELRGIGVQAEDTKEAFLDLDLVLKNGVSMSLADFTAAISNIGLEPEQIEKLTKGWHDFNDAVDDANTLTAVNDGLLGDQAQSIEDLFSQFEAGKISADEFAKGLQGVATALDALGEGDSAGRLREVVANVEAFTAARIKLAEAQGHAAGKYDADLKALEAMRGKPGVIASELDSLIASYQRLAKQDALEQQINKWGDYAKQIIPVVASAMTALGSTTDDVAGQWAEDLNNMTSDLVSFGTAIAKGNWVGAAVQAFTTIFSWFSRNKKAAQEAAKATADYNAQFKFSANGYDTRNVTKYSTGALFWKTDHYKEQVDEVGKALALSLENGFTSGIENGFNEAIKMNDFSLFEKSLTESVGQAVLKGLIDAFMQEEVLKGIIGPRIKAVIDARTTNDGGADDALALSNLKGAVGEANKAAQTYYNSILKPIADGFGLLGSGLKDATSSDTSATDSSSIKSINVTLPSATANLNFDVLQTLAGVVERAAPRIEIGGQAIVEGGGRILAAMDRLERLLGGAELKPTGSYK